LESKAKRYANLKTSNLNGQVASERERDTLRSMLDPRGTNRPANETPELMEDPEYLLCPSSIPVFTLDEQEWMVVCVEFISDADWPSEAFKGASSCSGEKDSFTEAHCSSR
jgi:hypothetical protein